MTWTHQSQAPCIGIKNRGEEGSVAGLRAQELFSDTTTR